jgi:hypothetical protein
MTAVPKPVHQRLAHTIKQAVNTVAVHGQQIIHLQSKIGTLQPGDWETIALQAGWSSLGGYIPAQVRIMQGGMSQVIGHITGGAVADNTVIGTLTSGFYNPTHQHTFHARAMTGAAAVPAAGALTSTAVSPVTVTSPGTIPVNPHTFTVSGGVITISSGALGSNDTGNGATVFASMAVSNGATATSVSYNTPLITLDTSGNLILSNVSAAVTSISFSELIPLVTA